MTSSTKIWRLARESSIEDAPAGFRIEERDDGDDPPGLSYVRKNRGETHSLSNERYSSALF